MNDAKERQCYYKVSFKTTEGEESLINRFFGIHAALKKGETIKQWILQAIESEESIHSGKTQLNTEAFENSRQSKE